MTQPLGEFEADSVTKAMGIMALIEMVDHMNQVVAAFEIAGVFTPEGTEVLSKKTATYFQELTNLINAEREIASLKKAQRDL
jgi:hypothetical protein